MNRTFTKSTTSDENSDDNELITEPMHLEFESNGSSTENDDDGDEEKPKKDANKKLKTNSKTGPKRPPFSDMLISAISGINDKKGASNQAIKTYIIANYFVSDAVIKRNLKSTLEKCLADGILIRPKPKKGAKEMTGLLGRFKVNPQWLKDKEKKKKALEKKKAQSAKRKTTGAKAKAPKIDGSNLTSLKDKPYSVRLAQDKVKQARKSLAMSPAVSKLAKKRPVARKKRPADENSSNATATKKAKTTKAKAEKTSPKEAAKKKKPKSKEKDDDPTKKKAASKATNKKPASKSKATTAKKVSSKSSKVKD